MTQPGIPEIDFEAPFNRAFEEIGTGVKLAIDTFNDIVGQVKRWFWTIAPPVLYWVRQRLDAVREVLRQVVERVEYAIEHQTPVLSLISASFAWLTDVQRPVSNIAGEVSRPQRAGFDTWSGDAADAYRRVVAGQQAAAVEVAGRADFISEWLFGIARANVDYAVELARIVTSLAGKLVEAATEVATVIDIPWAVEALAEAAGELFKAGLDNLLSIGVRFVEAIGNVRDLQARLGDQSRLPGGHWPEAIRG
nr:hypothetical protein [Micromonospora sp. DSM 115978]